METYMNIPTREELKKALGRKPVEGCSKGPWRANLYLGGAYAIDRVAPNGDVLTRIAVADGAMETRANGELLAMALDLQDENQVLQAAVRMLEKTLQNIADGCRLVCEPATITTPFEEEAFEAIVATIDDAETALAILPTEGESDD